MMARRVSDLSGPVRIGFDDRPYVPVEINGEGPFYFLLDTGAAGPDVTQRVADQLSLPVSPVHSTFRCLESLKIGDMEWRDLHMSVGKHRPFVSRLGHTHDGFIGSTMILDLAVTLDYPGSELHLQERVDGDRPAYCGPLHVELRRRDLYPYRYAVVDVRIHDSNSLRFLLDTGAGRCNISPQAVERLGLSVRKVNDRDAVEIPALDLYGWSAGPVSAYVLDCSHVQVEGPLDGYIGHNLLSQLRVVLDYPSQRLYLEPGQSGLSAD